MNNLKQKLNLNTNQYKSIKANFFRLAIFLILYTTIGILHPIIQEHFLGISFTQTDKYMAYLIYPISLIFILFRWDKIKNLPYYKNNFNQTIIFAFLSILILIIPWVRMAKEMPDFLYIIYFSVYFFTFFFLFWAIFNTVFLNRFFNEIMVIILAYIAFLAIEVTLINYWQYISYVIVWCTGKGLSPLGDILKINLDTFMVSLKDFTVYVDPVCAGLYSVVSFIFLFLIALLFASQRQKLNKTKTAIAIILGALVVFVLNIIRVMIIVIIGGFVSEKLAMDLFHEYLSAIFLLAIFIFYLYKVIPWLSSGCHCEKPL
ncbi:MAG: archaeosortase/exosortase family protein [Candidatus Magasanikbacteria bacterium]